MPHKDAEIRKAYAKLYQTEHKEKRDAWVELHKDELSAYQKEYRRSHAEERKEYEEKNREKINENTRRSYRNNREKRLAYRRKYVADNPGANSESCRKYREENDEKIKRHTAEYRKNNHAKIIANNATRRALKRSSAEHTLTAQQWIEIKEAYGHKCAYCGRKMQRLTQDHITPLSRGGAHVVQNVIPACQSCNSKKGTKTAPTLVQPLLLTVAPSQQPRKRRS